MNASPDGPSLIEGAAFVSPVMADEAAVHVEESRRAIVDEVVDGVADVRPSRGLIPYPYPDDGLRLLPEYEPPADDSAERTRQAIDRPTFVGRARQGIDVLMDQADPNPPTSCLDALDRQRQINGWVPPADPYSGGIPDDRV